MIKVAVFAPRTVLTPVRQRPSVALTGELTRAPVN